VNPDGDEAIVAGTRTYQRSLIAAESLRPGIGISLANVGYAAMASFIVLDLQAHGSSHGATAFTAFAATVVLTRLIGGDLPDRVGPLRCAAGAAMIEATGLALIALSHGLALALVGAVGMGMAFALLYPSLSLVVISTVPDGRRGSALGTFTAFFDIGVGLGGIACGIAASLGGYSAAFWLGSACALGTFAVASALRRASAAPATAEG
jgi:MFS family permease